MIKQVAHILQSNHLIGCFKMKGPLTVRYIQLNSNDIFMSLVDLYIIPFQAHWKCFSHMVSPHSLPHVNPVTYLARVYISHWFLDLYVSIRHACIRHECVDVSDHYDNERLTQSNYYDYFLTVLLQSMKPTHIIGCLEDSLYIPIINNALNFNITNFTYNPELFKELISKMKDPSTGWYTAAPSNEPFGRPCWLFDWHYGKAYAWFPKEGNYNYDDVNLAYIIGVPCTPLQSIRDEDFPRQYPNNIETETIDLMSLKRVLPKRRMSNIDVRTIKKQVLEIERPIQIQFARQVPTITAGGKEAEDVETPSALTLTQVGRTRIMETVTETRMIKFKVNLFSIVDYMYYACVLGKVEINMRSAAHMILTFKE